MGNVNKVILVGNLGADPELKHTATGKAYCHLRVATSDHFKNAQGERQERTEWHRVTVWADQAEHCARYLAKGRPVYVEGRLEHRSVEDRDKGDKRWYTDVVANRIVFLGGGEHRQATDQHRQAA
jgi:single-strand DNA-binding protein